LNFIYTHFLFYLDYVVFRWFFGFSFVRFTNYIFSYNFSFIYLGLNRYWALSWFFFMPFYFILL
jgi:hypothetical protein